MKLTIRSQLIFAFGSLIFMIIIIAGISMKVLSDANTRFESYVNGINARSMTAHLVLESVEARAIAARNLVLVKTQEDILSEKKLVENAHTDVSANLNKLVAMGKNTDVTDDVRKQIEEIARIEQQYAPVALDIVRLALDGQKDAAIEKMNAECRPLLAQLIKASEDYADATRKRESAMLETANSDYLLQRNMLSLGCLIALACAICAGTLIVRKLFRELGAEPAVLSEAVSRIADGNLSTPIECHHNDTHSVMAAMGRMQESLKRVVTDVRNGADSVFFASEEIVQSNTSLSARTESQASSLEETAASMEELGSTVKQNAENAKQARQLSHNATGIAEQGGNVVSQVIATMKEIDTSSQKIADIISVIDGIAFQTNILALNAAVEAARAGEQGRGFAVVAGEVRNLAGRCADAAKEIKSLITTSVEQVNIGSKLVDQAGLTMKEIVASISHVADIMNDISMASDEQNEGVGQVGEAVIQMDQTTQQNAAFVEEMSKAATSMQTQAQELVKAVSIFRLETAAAPLATVEKNIVHSFTEKSGRKPLPRPTPRLAAA